MLKLIDIKKDYAVAGETVSALKGVNLNFRRNEFVSILGPSGCGKTTLLNIIGGLDKYTSGDLIIEGKSTKEYKDCDWDTYRNHSIGFIFQSYHLIPHQTILQNVELALTIAGVSKEERRQRAIDALEKVGLKDKIKNRPNQLSGGQAQRVAIARALINNPEIVLADEPTGALDSVTSVQIMELLKEIAKERLVIMVTHNPELAETYSTRIVSLKDGEVTGDTMPYDGAEEETEVKEAEAKSSQPEEVSAPQTGGEDILQPVADVAAADGNETDVKGKKKKGAKKLKKQSSMSVGMAMGLSVKNLLSKRKRTAMVSIAGSIGIIGVSMVLAISAGVQKYIRTMENDMLSGNPVSITQTTYDFTTLMALNGDKVDKEEIERLVREKKVGVNSLLDTLGTFSTGLEKTNNFSEGYLDYLNKMPEESVTVKQYKYSFNIINNLYTDFTVSDNLSAHFDSGETNTGHPFVTSYKNTYNMSVAGIRAMYSNILNQVEGYRGWGGMISSVSTFSEVPDSFDYIMNQYDVLAMDKSGNVVTENFSTEELKEIFKDKQSLIMVVENNSVDDLTLAQYGYFTEDEFLDYAIKGVGDAEDAHLKFENGADYAEFIGKDSKKFVYYGNNSVYSESSYVPLPTVSDSTLFNMLDPNVAYAIFRTRKQGIEQLGNLYDDAETKYMISVPMNNTTVEIPMTMQQYMSMLSAAMAEYIAGFDLSTKEKFVDMFHIPTEEESRPGYTACAYSDGYVFENNKFDPTDDITFAAFNKDDGLELGVKLILQKKADVSYGCLATGFYYTNALTDYILTKEADSKIVKFINDGNELSEVSMYIDYYYVDPEMDKSGDKEATLTPDGRKYYKLATALAPIEGVTDLMSSIIDSVIGGMGSAGLSTGESKSLSAAMFAGERKPVAVNFYTVDFEKKDAVTAYLDEWNDWCKNGSEYTYTNTKGESVTVKLQESDKITYTDTVGLIIDMINTMIKMITIALVSFTALSLVVSTVMIGIITYVSVVERVKEIGILRAVGARKKDIKRLFNAETFIIGLIAGLFGILVTYLLSLVINIVVLKFAGVWGIAALPWWQAVIMVALSIGLTLISGLIPAAAAAKKDPVVALRTE